MPYSIGGLLCLFELSLFAVLSTPFIISLFSLLCRSCTFTHFFFPTLFWRRFHLVISLADQKVMKQEKKGTQSGKSLQWLGPLCELKSREGWAPSCVFCISPLSIPHFTLVLLMANVDHSSFDIKSFWIFMIFFSFFPLKLVGFFFVS